MEIEKLNNVKRCSKCGEVKEHDISNSQNTGLQSYCKECQIKYKIMWRKTINGKESMWKENNSIKAKIRKERYNNKPESKEKRRISRKKYRDNCDKNFLCVQCSMPLEELTWLCRTCMDKYNINKRRIYHGGILPEEIIELTPEAVERYLIEKQQGYINKGDVKND